MIARIHPKPGREGMDHGEIVNAEKKFTLELGFWVAFGRKGHKVGQIGKKKKYMMVQNEKTEMEN